MAFLIVRDTGDGWIGGHANGEGTDTSVRAEGWAGLDL
jgi:hypothetical protein